MKLTRKYGLIGKNISYSFSSTFFKEKFEKENQYNFSYQNFDIQSLVEFKSVLINNPNLVGLNVTIPYKETIIPFLDKLSKKAKAIGAVNVIKFTKKNKLKGCNSDYYGFKKSLQPLLKSNHKKALILGTGGASKAVAFALTQLGIEYSFVSRKGNFNTLDYKNLSSDTFSEFQIVINCTPLGTFPDINLLPDLPYSFFTANHIAFDLIYNPAQTTFLKKASENGAVCKNGLEMLIFQAEKAWKIWNK